MKKAKQPIGDNTPVIVIITFFVAGIAVMLLPRMVNSLEPYYYASQIIAAIFVVVAGIAALWQYRATYKFNKTHVDDLRVQRAIDLMCYYKDNILSLYPALWYVFEKCGINEIVGNIPLSCMVSFDEEEMRKIFTPAQITKLKGVQEKPEFFAAVIEADEIYGLGLNLEKEVDSSIKEDGSMQIKVTVNAHKTLVAFMTNVKNCMLNNMEYFAIAFTHNTADESVVYQSLHQTYIKAVQLMYYSIASMNTSTTEKYYTNVIELFSTWKKRNEEQENKRKEQVKSGVHSGTIVD